MAVQFSSVSSRSPRHAHSTNQLRETGDITEFSKTSRGAGSLILGCRAHQAAWVALMNSNSSLTRR